MFFGWCQDLRISNLVIPECQMNLYAFSYIEVIKVAPLIATTIWFNNNKTYLYTLVTYLKAWPLRLCIIQIITIILLWTKLQIDGELQDKDNYKTWQDKIWQYYKIEGFIDSSTSLQEGFSPDYFLL
jgi:hypothetical protein